MKVLLFRLSNFPQKTLEESWIFFLLNRNYKECSPVGNAMLFITIRHVPAQLYNWNFSFCENKESRMLRRKSQQENRSEWIIVRGGIAPATGQSKISQMFIIEDMRFTFGVRLTNDWVNEWITWKQRLQLIMLDEMRRLIVESD